MVEGKLVSEFIGWSNGKIVRRYQGQDTSDYNYRTTKSRGFRKMLIKVYEIEEVNENGKHDTEGEV